MEFLDFTKYPQNEKAYGGTAGRKIGITMDGQDYLLKYPGNLKIRQMKNIVLSYSNSPVCEYIGSHIYKMAGIPVHETILGTRDGKNVVACKDFLNRGDTLQSFADIKVSTSMEFVDSGGNETDGLGTDLQECLSNIRENPLLHKLKYEAEDRFWDMFVVDALIGNLDRNNLNWGVIYRYDGIRELAPVYDNGNCLNCKWDDAKMKEILSSEKSTETEAFTARRCIFEENGKAINPYKYIRSMETEGCSQALLRIFPKLDMDRIAAMIEEIPVISDTEKQFYKTIISTRLEAVLRPVYQIVNGRTFEEKMDAYSRLAEERKSTAGSGLDEFSH